MRCDSYCANKAHLILRMHCALGVSLIAMCFRSWATGDILGTGKSSGAPLLFPVDHHCYYATTLLKNCDM
jgi:hypothetical protein